MPLCFHPRLSDVNALVTDAKHGIVRHTLDLCEDSFTNIEGNRLTAMLIEAGAKTVGTQTHSQVFSIRLWSLGFTASVLDFGKTCGFTYARRDVTFKNMCTCARTCVRVDTREMEILVTRVWSTYVCLFLCLEFIGVARDLTRVLPTLYVRT